MLKLPLLLGVAWLLLPGNGEKEPLLEVMYLKYRQQPIDTTPVFNPMVSEYKAVLDWKMKFFSVQAKPVSPAVIDNIHLCQNDANCLKQDQSVVTMDFSKNIEVEPGSKVLYMFDVLLQGVVRSYRLYVQRLEGSEVNIRHMIIHGSTIYPAFRSDTHAYRCLLDVWRELATLELHLQDGGQTILASADAPVALAKQDNITVLKNTHPGNTRAPSTRLRLRRLREEAFGEFQYPNKYVEFPVPLASKRTVSFKVISADGGHFGYYTLELARGSCTASAPLFDVSAGRCVRFCNAGFWADYKARRCKGCQRTCLSCLSPHRCIRCPESSRLREYKLNNATGMCIARERALWDRHPQHAIALTLAVACLSVFLCGLGAFRLAQANSAGRKQRLLGGSGRSARGAAAPPPGGHAAPQRGPQGTGGTRFLRGGPAAAGYAPISSDDWGGP